MDLKALKRLSEESPFEGERENAKEKLKILRKSTKLKIDLDKPVIYFNRIFKKYRNKWFYIKYELEKFGIFEVKFLYLGLFRHGKKNQFSFLLRRGKFFDKEKQIWDRFPFKQISANNVIEIKVNKVGNFIDIKEFLRLVGFSYTKKLPSPDLEIQNDEDIP